MHSASGKVRPYRAEVHRRLKIDPSACAPGHALQQLALVDRDKEAVVQLFGGDLAGVHRYVVVAGALLAIDCRADALEWTRRGMALPASWQSRKLYDLAADVLAGDGELAQVVDLRREGLEALPDSTSYAALREAARATGQWDGLRDGALALLARRSPDAHPSRCCPTATSTPPGRHSPRRRCSRRRPGRWRPVGA